MCEPTPCVCPDGSMTVFCPPLVDVCPCEGPGTGGDDGTTGEPPLGCSVEVVVSSPVEASVSSTSCLGGAAMGSLYLLGYGDLGLSVFAGEQTEGSFDGDVVDLSFDLDVDGTIVAVWYEECSGVGSWTGGGSVTSLRMSGEVDCTGVVPTARDSETGEALPDVVDALEIAPFSFEWS